MMIGSPHTEQSSECDGTRQGRAEDEDDGGCAHRVEGVDDVAFEERQALLELVDDAAERGPGPDEWIESRSSLGHRYFLPITKG